MTMPETFFAAVCRWDLCTPGVALLDLGRGTPLEQIAAEMLAIQEWLSVRFRARKGWSLIRMTAERFDNRTSGPLHRDGGADESILVLGYAPTAVTSELRVCDISACAAHHGQTPACFLEQNNPIFGGGALLAPYTRPVEGFLSAHGQIVVINNSITSPGDGMLGLLHAVTILPSRPSPRVVLSMQLAPAAPSTPDRVDQAALAPPTSSKRSQSDVRAR